MHTKSLRPGCALSALYPFASLPIFLPKRNVLFIFLAISNVCVCVCVAACDYMYVYLALNHRIAGNNTSPGGTPLAMAHKKQKTLRCEWQSTNLRKRTVIYISNGRKTFILAPDDEDDCESLFSNTLQENYYH